MARRRTLRCRGGGKSRGGDGARHAEGGKPHSPEVVSAVDATVRDAEPVPLVSGRDATPARGDCEISQRATRHRPLHRLRLAGPQPGARIRIPGTSIGCGVSSGFSSTTTRGRALASCITRSISASVSTMRSASRPSSVVVSICVPSPASTRTPMPRSKRSCTVSMTCRRS